MPGPLDSIVVLYRTQQELAAAEARLQGIPDWMRETHEKHQRGTAEIAAVEATRDEAEQERRTAEVELADAQEKASHYQNQIVRVVNQREYAALLKEIDTVKEQIRVCEQRALEAMERQEEAQAQLAQLNEQFRDLDQRHQAELAKWEQEKPSVAATVADLRGQVKALRDQLPAGSLRLFDRIDQHLRGQALGRVLRTGGKGTNASWYCEACSYSVRPQIVVEIRDHGSLNQCDSCKRILYWDESAE